MLCQNRGWSCYTLWWYIDMLGEYWSDGNGVSDSVSNVHTYNITYANDKMCQLQLCTNLCCKKKFAYMPTVKDGVLTSTQ